MNSMLLWNTVRPLEQATVPKMKHSHTHMTGCMKPLQQAQQLGYLYTYFSAGLPESQHLNAASAYSTGTLSSAYKHPMTSVLLA